MSLSEKSRSSLYRGLSAVVRDEEAVGEMLAHFPARELDEPVTEHHLRAEVAVLDRKMTEGFAAVDRKMTDRFADVDRRMTEGFADVDRRMTAGFADVDRRMTAGFAEVHGELASIRVDMVRLEQRLSDDMRRWYVWTMGSMVTLLGLFVAALRLLDTA